MNICCASKSVVGFPFSENGIQGMDEVPAVFLCECQWRLELEYISMNTIHKSYDIPLKHSV